MPDSLSAEEFVEYCYKNILGREADLDGRKHYLDLLQKGYSYLELIDVFLKSWEYRKKRLELASGDPFLQFAPPGHFDSPLPEYTSLVDTYYSRRNGAGQVAAVDFNIDEQLSLLEKISGQYRKLPWKKDKQAGKQGGLRYFLDNDAYPYGDGICLYAMLKIFQPKKIIEVGSGYSSAAMLDTLEESGLKTELKIIDPYPEVLFDLLKESDAKEKYLLQEKVETLALSFFESLQENDLLFIDSSHTVKFSSDVHYLITRVLPALNKGVLVHFHDIFFPFEYPLPWLLKGRAWNEAYFLRAFLMYNQGFKILFFNDLIGKKYRKLLGEKLPLARENPGHGLWLKKCV